MTHLPSWRTATILFMLTLKDKPFGKKYTRTPAKLLHSSTKERSLCYMVIIKGSKLSIWKTTPLLKWSTSSKIIWNTPKSIHFHKQNTSALSSSTQRKSSKKWSSHTTNTKESNKAPKYILNSDGNAGAILLFQSALSPSTITLELHCGTILRKLILQSTISIWEYPRRRYFHQK